MENTQEQKTPEQWFQKLKEPYRSKAIKAIVFNHDKKFDSLIKALMCSTNWIVEGFEEIVASLNKGETTYLEPETLIPKQMESGKWYVIENRFKYLSKFKEIIEKYVYEYKGYSYYDTKINDNIPLCFVDSIKSIRTATKEEVLKYFPDEVFEPIELRPEDLISGEVYTLVSTEFDRKFTFIHKHYVPNVDNPILYTKMYAHNLEKLHYNNCFSLSSAKFYHATPEEKKLLLGEEEPTDWEAKYNELLDVIEKQKKIITMLRDEPKGKKVYFYWADRQYYCNVEKQEAIDNSDNFSEIYEAYCIGKKKSVLVNETT